MKNSEECGENVDRECGIIPHSLFVYMYFDKANLFHPAKGKVY